MKVIDWWFGKILKRYDFEMRCLFPHQLSYEGLSYNGGDNVKVPFKSGRIGIYKVEVEDYNIFDPDRDFTSQKNWRFKFKRFVTPFA